MVKREIMKKSWFIILVFLIGLVVMTACCVTDIPPSPPGTPDTSWSGTWSTTWSTANHATLEPTDDLILTQTGTTVTGTYPYVMGNLTGSLSGTVDGTKLSGTWIETDESRTLTGTIEFILFANGDAFTGTWTTDQDYADGVTNTTYLWHGVRKE